MVYSIRNLTFISVLIGTVTLLSSCDIANTQSNGNQKVPVKMRVQTSTVAKQLNTMPTTQSVDSLTEVKFLVEELELKSAADEDSLDFETKNMVINLPLDGSDLEVTSDVVPEGMYDEFEMKIEHDDDISVQDPDFSADSTNEDGYSMVIRGIYNGENFTYRSSEDFELEMDLNPPLEISDTTSASIAVNINIDSWFVDPETGEQLDPTNPDNRERIDESIEKSFDAEHEHHEDEHENDGSDDGSSDDD